MTTYFLSLLGAAMVTAVVGVLLPGNSSGIAKHVRLICTLILICILAAPLPNFLSNLQNFSANFSEVTSEENFDARANTALDAASRSYFVRALTTHLEQKFDITEGEIRCAIQWEESETEVKPKSVTLILSGNARWKSPHELKSYLTDLLNCPCEVAIE